jgi:phosphoglycolate phosphatase
LKLGGFHLVVFDLDGTLVDSLRDLAESANSLLVECGGTPLADHSIGRMVGDGAARLVARAFHAAGLVPPADALERFLAIYDRRLLEFTRPYPGVDDLLTMIGSRMSMAVLTNKPLAATREILDGLDLARHFPKDRVIGGDGPLPRKPDPSGLKQLAAAHAVSLDETLLVGDSIVDWKTARAANAKVCMARYGFGFEGVPLSDRRSADFLIDRPSDLLELL